MTSRLNSLYLSLGLAKISLKARYSRQLTGTVDLLVSEELKSLSSSAFCYAGKRIERIVVTGGAAVVPEFPLYLANKFNLNVEIGNAWRNVSFSRGVDRTNYWRYLTSLVSQLDWRREHNDSAQSFARRKDAIYQGSTHSKYGAGTAAIIISLASVALLVLLVLVGGLQKKHISDLNKDIKSDTATLQNKPEIEKF